MSTLTKHWPETLRAVWQLYHDHGYTVIIRNGYVYLFHAGAPRHCLRTEIDNGRWITQPAVDAFIESHLYEDMAGAIEARVQSPWEHVSAELPVETVMEFRAVTRDCYCYQCVQRCDFCTGMRRPDRYRYDFPTLAAAQEYLAACDWTQEAPCYFRKGNRWASIRGDGSGAGLPTIYEVRTGDYKPYSE